MSIMENTVSEAPAVAADKPEIEKRIEQFIMLRDKLAAEEKAHKERMAPIRALKDKLEGRLTELLNLAGGDSLSVRGVGTVYRTVEASATVGDKEAFRRYLEQSGNLDMVSLTANKVAVRDYIEEKGEPPPGVNYRTHATIGVRRD